VLLSASSAESLWELLVASLIMMGSSTVSPCASISIVAFSAVADGLASVSDPCSDILCALMDLGISYY